MIGPSYVDINAKVRELPKGNEDMDILSTSQKISGSGYVCANVFEKLGMDYELISPVGEGVYGDAVKKQALEDHIVLQYVDEMMNGWTYYPEASRNNRRWLDDSLVYSESHEENRQDN